MGNKQKVYIAVPILIVIAIVVAFFYEWEVGSKLNPELTAYNMVDLAEIVNSQIDEGKSKGSFYVSGITEEELSTINDYVCSVNGMADRFVISERSRSDKMKVVYYYEISDNYYVKEKYLNGKDIPSDRPKAKKLYEKLVEVLDKIITPGMSDYEKELAIHDYLVSSCVYGQLEASPEYAFRAYGAIVQQTAVCNGYAEAMSLMLTCVGIENTVMTGTADGELHAWNRVCLDENWYQVDVTWDDPIPDTGSFVGHTYFNVTDDMMDDSHTWNKELFEGCEDTTYNYYSLNNLVYQYDDLELVFYNESIKNITAKFEVMVTDYNENVYTYDFISHIPGVLSISHMVQEIGDAHVITIYLN